MKKLLILTCAAVAAAVCNAKDVFSDAKSWHQGFVDVNGDGYLNKGSGKMEFPESLLLAEPNNAAHTVTFGPNNYSKEISGVHTGVVLRTENVVNPYTKVSWSETVGYFPQDSDVDSNSYWTAGLFPNEPFTVNMDGECTFFLRFRWDGTFPAPDKGINFFAAGNPSGYGFQLSIGTAGRYGIYSATIIGSKTWNGASDAKLAADKWTDFAITVSNRHVTVYSIQEGDKHICTMTVNGGSSNPSGAANSSIVLGLAQEGAFDWNSGLSTATRAQAFRGSIQSYAAWDRALSADEVRQVFAWPASDLVRLGTANDSVQEFVNGEVPTTFSFDVAAKDAGLAQVLRVTATSTSEAGSFSVSLNGAVLGSLEVAPGKTSLFPIKKNLTVSGANTITLTRVSADPVAIDAIALGGGIQIGSANGSSTDFAPETYGGKVFADVKTFHRGAIPYHGDNWVFTLTSGNPEFPESLDGNAASKAHLVAFNSPTEASRYFGTSGTHTGIVVRTENVVYPYARRTESTKALYFPQDTEAQDGGKYKYWTCGLHLNTNNVPFIPKFDAAGDACTFFMRFRWDGTVPIPGKPAFFLGAGDTTGGTYGLSVGVYESGRIYFYSSKPNLSKTWNGENDVTITPNKWTDFAITLSNRKVTIYIYQEDSQSVAVMSATASGASPASYDACNSFVIGHSRTGLAGDTWTGSQGRAYGFRGSIHSFAAWERALSADEVRQVFAWPGERAFVNLGVLNASSAEFGGTATSDLSAVTAGAVSGAVDWFNARGTFADGMTQLRIVRNGLTADEINSPNRTLRLTTTSDSDTSAFSLTVNGTSAGTITATPGVTAYLAVPKGLFAENNTLLLTRTTSGATVKVDALSIVVDAAPYYATDSDQSDCVFGHYEIENGVEKRQPTNLHVDVPDAIAGRDNYFARVLVRFKGGATAQTLALTVNGAAEPVATFAALVSDAFQEFKAKIPASMLRAGDNVLTLSNAANGEGTAYLDVDYVRMETCVRYGMTIVVQ
ncbi:MAG: hypothetical protein IJG84_24840 [Kiritimatiellae bacterium]|nr:hypothetical protein [Kiritimatiellia bacterium]